ncbi:Siderophore-interacting protein [Catenulispora acidiphila DSM 44928]|uniref:Siderophore-interacting protein n=1 Tax=Catenulispora acidiphila (strain DSM 44928 / JCM 14897 / NBRC 102108 / NRRL B-24433 / ID139908) TaxID=479433 RepID=C7Q963_CATAD|nr:siderophore-interacting protein [Catenulispora acidiphila]ACU72383.1 Siderophore-interacting protein [Catenulispora acidiphila DSM 44928]
MTERPERGAGGRRRGAPPRLAHVQRVERVTPHMIRVVLGGPGLEGLEADQYTDHYVKILFPLAGVEYPEPFDMQQVREEMPRELWPSVRTYSVRAWDAAKLELTIDFVYHGDEGIAGPWAARAQPGDPVRFSGPGGGYAPDPDADWHLLAGDESALPAIAAALERMPEGARVHAFIEVSDSAEEQKLETGADATITWLHRGDAPAGKTLVDAVSGFDFPEGAVHAFVHGEAGFVKELRRLLFIERGVPRDQVSISGYWRLGHDEDGWQAGKRAWNAQVEADQDGTGTAS